MTRPLCTKCNKNLAKKLKTGNYSNKCDTCRRKPESVERRNAKAIAKLKEEKRPYFKFRKDYCENAECTATITHPCQLDVDHIDGNHQNNDESNLMTLCANCHRIKSYEESMRR